MAYAVVVGGLAGATAVWLERAVAASRVPRRSAWAAMIAIGALAGLGMPWAADRLAGSTGVTTARIAPVTAMMRGEVGAQAWRARLQEVASAAAKASLPFDGIARRVWLFGTAGLVLVYGVSAWTLARRRRGWRADSMAGTPVLVAPHEGPAVVGVWRSRIVVPDWAMSLDPPLSELLILHEREHQRARDPLLVHLAGLALVLMPWNPATWWMVRRLRLALELDCDARVLARAAGRCDARVYADLLLTVASRRSTPGLFGAPAMLGRRSSLSRRISAMYLDRSQSMVTRVFASLGAAVLAGLILVVPAPVLRAAQAAAPKVVVIQRTPPQPPVYEIGNGVQAPSVVRSQNPFYTREALAAKISGEVEVSGVVEPDGSLDQIRIAKSLDTVHGLDQAALDAAKKWRFTPGTKDGKPVPVRVTLLLEFRLRDLPPKKSGRS
jgi:TonB family protein